MIPLWWLLGSEVRRCLLFMPSIVQESLHFTGISIDTSLHSSSVNPVLIWNHKIFLRISYFVIQFIGLHPMPTCASDRVNVWNTRTQYGNLPSRSRPKWWRDEENLPSTTVPFCDFLSSMSKCSNFSLSVSKSTVEMVRGQPLSALATTSLMKHDHSPKRSSD